MRINGFMFLSLSVLNLEDRLGLVVSPQSLLSAGHITLRTAAGLFLSASPPSTPGGIVGFLVVSDLFIVTGNQ